MTNRVRLDRQYAVAAVREALHRRRAAARHSAAVPADGLAR
jgi:hypothetical protein